MSTGEREIVVLGRTDVPTPRSCTICLCSLAENALCWSSVEIDLLLLCHSALLLTARTLLFIGQRLAFGSRNRWGTWCDKVSIDLSCPWQCKAIVGIARDKMNVKMEHSLSGVLALRELSVVVEVFAREWWQAKMLDGFAHQFTWFLHGTGDGSRRDVGIFLAVCDMLFRDDENVTRSAGAEWDDADGVLPLVDHDGWNLAS